MSVWGKILGGAAGFALGGPIGALVGALAGHAVDRMNGGGGETAVADGTREIAFTIGVIVLGAKLAKADGHVNRKEVDAFKRSEEHTSELQSLMRISYAVFCLKKTNKPSDTPTSTTYQH